MRPLYKFHSHLCSSHSQIASLIRHQGFKSILDLGCAGGFLKTSLGRYWPGTIIGVEKNRTWKSQLQSYSRVIYQDLNRSFPKVKTEVTVAADVLEHLKNPSKTLSQVTSPFLIVSLPNAHYLPYRIIHSFFPNFQMSAGPFDSTHLHFYSKQAATNLIDGSNYTILNTLVTPAPIFPKIGHLLAKTIPDHFAYQFIFFCRRAATP